MFLSGKQFHCTCGCLALYFFCCRCFRFRCSYCCCFSWNYISSILHFCRPCSFTNTAGRVNCLFMHTCKTSSSEQAGQDLRIVLRKKFHHKTISQLEKRVFSCPAPLSVSCLSSQVLPSWFSTFTWTISHRRNMGGNTRGKSRLQSKDQRSQRRMDGLGEYIPHICHKHHKRCLCKFFLSGVIFFLIEREKFAFYCIVYNNLRPSV